MLLENDTGNPSPMDAIIDNAIFLHITKEFIGFFTPKQDPNPMSIFSTIQNSRPKLMEDQYTLRELPNIL